MKAYFPLVILLVICAVLCFRNYTTNTFLSGWDSLHPEFNFPLAFERSIFGTYRPDEGLGAVAAHAHMADLPHVVILFLLSFLIPLSFLRYSYMFLCLVTGIVGMYYFLHKITEKKTIWFLGSLFYLLNIGTLQQFFVPFEMFTTQYAILPFLFLFSIDYIHTPNRKNLILFSLATLFAAPVAFASVLWYVQFVCLVSCICILSFIQKRIHQAFVLIGITLALNAFWILPNLYFLTTSAKYVQQAAMNQLFSEEAFLYNKSYGNIWDILLMRSFYFSWSAYNSTQGFHYLLSTWLPYLANPGVIIIQLVFAFFAIGGAIKTSVVKHPILVSLFPSLFLVIFFLFTTNPPLGFVYSLLQKLPFFQEAFRFPDDKVLGLFTFLFSVFFAFGVDNVPRIKSYVSIPLLFAIFLVMFPSFEGNLLSPEMRVKIPEKYFSLFSYMDSLPDGRILTFPMENLWGWQYYNWNNPSTPGSTLLTTRSGLKDNIFQGSGFLWFGIKQPMMDRDFDRWNPDNETAYQAFSQALYSRDTHTFTNLLHKYNISYILLDQNVFVPSVREHALWTPETKDMLSQIPHLQVKKEFGNLRLYTLQHTTLLDTVSDFPSPETPVVDNMGQTQPLSPLTLALSKLPIISPNLSFLKEAGLHLSHNDCQMSPFTSHNLSPVWDKEIYPGFVRYSSRDGSLCDHMDFPYPLDKRSYILSLKARNIAGLPLRICVSDPATSKCVLYTKLAKSSDFTSQYFFVPSLSGSKRFGVDINSIGIFGTESINDVADIQIHPLPQSLQESQPEPKTQDYPLSYTTFFNKSFVFFQTTEKRIILNQSYDPGWILVNLSTGEVIPYHRKVNRWANGWDLASEKVPITSNSYIIVFLPQLLEFLGFGVMIFLFVLFIRQFVLECMKQKRLYQGDSPPRGRGEVPRSDERVLKA